MPLFNRLHGRIQALNDEGTRVLPYVVDNIHQPLEEPSLLRPVHSADLSSSNAFIIFDVCLRLSA